MTKKTKTEQELEDRLKEELTFVVYVDGGARPQHGYTGAGFHGYLHGNEITKKGQGIKVSPSINGYLDNRDASEEVVVLKYIDYHEAISQEGTNNQAELTAVIRALDYVLDSDYNIKRIFIHADSKYVVDGISTNLELWKSNNWCKSNGEKIANLYLWEMLDDIKSSLDEKGISIEINWIEAHAGHLGNEAADTLATRGVILASKGKLECELTESNVTKYWNPSIDYNRMMSKSHCYFITNTETQMNDGFHIYYMGHHGNDNTLHGKPIAEASFAVGRFKEPQFDVDAVKKFQNSLYDTTVENVVLLNLDLMHRPKYQKEIMEHGGKFLNREKKTNNIVFADDVRLTEEMRPARRSFQAIETLKILEGVMTTRFSDKCDTYLKVSDVTDYLYECETKKTGEVKCKLKPEITNSLKSIATTIDYRVNDVEGSANLQLVMDLDIPSRNTMSALAGSCPKVEVVTWEESNHGFRYATIVTCGEDSLITASPYANLYVLPPTEK